MPAKTAIRISQSFSPDEIMEWAEIVTALQRGDRPDIHTERFQKLAKKAIGMRIKLKEKRAALAAESDGG